jgi:hypothetical protein
METNPTPAGDLNELERRLSEWRPSTTGLSADQMLFASGRDSVRPWWGRNASLIASGCLAVVATVLGAGLLHEREARLDLLAQLQNQRPADVLTPSTPSELAGTLAAEPPAASSYFAAHAALEQDPDAWLDRRRADSVVGPALPGRPILKANSPGEMLEP